MRAILVFTLMSNLLWTSCKNEGGSASNDPEVEGAQSPEPSLEALTISDGELSPAFDSEVTTYTASVAHATSTLVVDPKVGETGTTASVRVGSDDFADTETTLNLEVGANVIEIMVTAPDGATNQIYTITVTRAESSDATLASLALSTGNLTPAFDAGTTSYTAIVEDADSDVTVTPSTASKDATVAVRANDENYVSVKSGKASGILALDPASNTIDIKVTAQDGTIKTYSVTLTLGSSVSTLGSLALSQGVLAPTFAEDTSSYTSYVSYQTGSLMLTATSTHSGSSMTVSSTNLAITTLISGASSSIPLVVGTNQINVTVTSENEAEVSNYVVAVTRRPNATLAADWTPHYDRLVGYWTLNGTGSISGGDTFSEVIANADAVVTNANASGMSYVTGKVDDGVEFDGTDDAAIADVTLPVGAAERTIMLWFKTSQTGSTRRLLAYGGPDTSSCADTVRLQVENSDRLSIDISCGVKTWNTGGMPADGLWHHWAIVVPASGSPTLNDLLFYFDGELLTSAFNSSTTAINTGTVAKLYIGKMLGSGTNYFQGSLDDIAIWDKALTSSEIETIYERQSDGQ
ncbi:MAG: cadherin-like beta sandwich domain-containing protein [Oligoflexales bacterium]